MTDDIDDGVIQRRNHADSPRSLVRKGIPHQVGNGPRQNPQRCKNPLLETGEVGGRGQRQPPRVRVIGEHLHDRRLDHPLEDPEGRQAHRQTEGQQGECAVSLDSRGPPRHQEAEFGNHASDDGRREQPPPRERPGERHHGSDVGNGEWHQIPSLSSNRHGTAL